MLRSGMEGGEDVGIAKVNEPVLTGQKSGLSFLNHACVSARGRQIHTRHGWTVDVGVKSGNRIAGGRQVEFDIE